MKKRNIRISLIIKYEERFNVFTYTKDDTGIKKTRAFIIRECLFTFNVEVVRRLYQSFQNYRCSLTKVLTVCITELSAMDGEGLH